MKKILVAFLLSLAFVATGAFEDVTWQGIAPFIITSSGEAKAAPNCSSAGPCSVITAPVNAVGGLQVVGSIQQTAIGTPSAGSVTNIGTAGSTTYTYACVAQDINGLDTIPSATFTTTTGNATLSATNFNRVFCGGQAGAVAYRVLKADTAHKIGLCFTQPNQACSVDDNSTSAGTSYTANTIDQTGATGNSASSRTFHMGTSNAVVSNSVANFIALDGASTAVAAAAEGDVIENSVGVSTIKNLTCQLTTAGGVVTVAGGTSYVLALRQNQATSTLTCTILAGASACTDVTHVITTAAQDQLDFIDTPSGTPTALVVHCSIEQDL